MVIIQNELRRAASASSRRHRSVVGVGASVGASVYHDALDLHCCIIALFEGTTSTGWRSFVLDLSTPGSVGILGVGS